MAVSRKRLSFSKAPGSWPELEDLTLFDYVVEKGFETSWPHSPNVLTMNRGASRRFSFSVFIVRALPLCAMAIDASFSITRAKIAIKAKRAMRRALVTDCQPCLTSSGLDSGPYAGFL